MTTTVDAAIERSRAMAASIEHDPGAHRMLTGDRPTGDLHVGHYLSSLRSRVALQERGVGSFVLIADYQVITDRDSGRRDQGEHAVAARRLSRRGDRPGPVDDLRALGGAGSSTS